MLDVSAVENTEPEQIVEGGAGLLITGTVHTHEPAPEGQLVTVVHVGAVVFTKVTVPPLPVVPGLPLLLTETVALLALTTELAAAENVFCKHVTAVTCEKATLA